MRRQLSLLAALLLLATAPVSAATVHDQQVWGNVTAMGSAGRLLYFVEAQPRLADGANKLSQLLLRGALGTPVTRRLSLYGGYLYVHLPVESGPDAHEHRAFAQINWSLGELAGGTLSTRTRIEHRQASHGTETSWRARSMIRYVHPLRDALDPKALVWTEPFVTFNRADWNRVKGFDQLRTFAGLELPLPGKSTMEVGYMNQLVNAAGPVNRVNHIASLTLFLRP